MPISLLGIVAVLTLAQTVRGDPPAEGLDNFFYSDLVLSNNGYMTAEVAMSTPYQRQEFNLSLSTYFSYSYI